MHSYFLEALHEGLGRRGDDELLLLAEEEHDFLLQFIW